MKIAGRWEGKLLDASGPVARVVTDLNESRGRVKGEFSVYFGSARNNCEGAVWKLAQTAPVSGSFNSRGGRLRMKYKLDIGRKPITASFEAKLTEADPHARGALIGSYKMSDEGKQIGLEGGACILWRYGK
ncbi:MAG: hypothetical protein PVH37_20895 [Desulfobacterales bacterium]|jgi:hypothetical protein